MDLAVPAPKRSTRASESFIEATARRRALEAKHEKRVIVLAARTDAPLIENNAPSMAPEGQESEQSGDGPQDVEPRILTNNETLTHLLKASLGTGILAMPQAFQAVGLVAGVFLTIFVSFVCTHCCYILIKSAHVLYRKANINQMGIAEVGEAALHYGPQWGRRWSKTFRIFILVSMFTTYFGVCSIYTVIVATNVLQVVAHYTNVKADDINETRIYIMAFLLPLILLVWVPNLKRLAPVSMFAIFLMAVGLGITVYYLVATDDLDFNDVNLVQPIVMWPHFFSITIFAMEAIGVMMPLENSMKTPEAMLGYCGVLVKGMLGVSISYILLGFLGYLRYGDTIEDSITFNLDQTQIPAQIVKIVIAMAIFCTFGLQFFVCMDILRKVTKNKFKRPVLADYIIRTVLCILCVLVAVAVPKIGPLIGLIGAFGLALLGIIAPAFIEVLTYWDVGFGPYHYFIWKNLLILIFGILAFVFGTTEAVAGIIKIYS